MTAPTGPDRTGVAARLDALEAAWKAATPGPWRLDAKGWIDGGEYDTVIGPGSVDCMAYCYGGTSTIEGDNLSADAAAIVAEHNAFGDLLAAVRGVLSLADEMAASADMPDTHGEFDRGVAAHQRDAADRLRAVVAAALGEA